MAHKLQGKDWKSMIFVVDVVNGKVTEVDDGYIDIEDIDESTGKIKKCSHRGGASGAFDLHGAADDNTVDKPAVELHQEDSGGHKMNPRYAGKLTFESADGKLKIISGAVLHNSGLRPNSQQEDTWVATKQG